MAYYDNPAGRLHDLLTRLAEQPHQGSILNGWAGVLGVDPDDVVVRLGRVAELVRQIQEEVDRSGEDALPGPVKSNRAAWARPIFPQDQAFDGQLINVLPDAAALQVLGLVSAQLHRIAPEGLIPDEEKLGDLKSKLREVIDAVQAAEDLPDELKRLLISRLRDVEEAIAHIDIGGPSAVRHAMEAVVGSMVIVGGPRFWKTPAFKKVLAVLAIGWTLFTAGPEIHNSLEAWGDIPHQLTAGVERVAHDSKESPAAHNPPPADGDHGSGSASH